MVQRTDHPMAIWTVRSMILGLAVGPAIVLLSNLVRVASSIRTLHPILLYAIPLGALLTAFGYQKLGPYLKEGGNQVIDLINQGILDIAHPTTIRYEQDRIQHSQHISTKMAPLLLANTFITHLVGASGGKEGVGVQIGASIGSYLGRLESKVFGYKEPIKQTGIYLISGAGAAFGALFNAPIAGTLFGMQFSNPRVNRTDALLPCIIASFTANQVSQAMGIRTFAPSRPVAFPLDLNTLLVLVVLGILFGTASRFFCYIIHLTKQGLATLTTNPYVKAGVSGSLLLGVSLLINEFEGGFPYNGLSIELLLDAESGQISRFAPMLKLLLTALTIGAGFAGGEVIPIMVIGSCTALLLAPLTMLPVSALSMLGAIGMLSGATKLPLACFVLGLELYGYCNPTPLFIVCAISYLVSGQSGIYERQIKAQVIEATWEV